MKQLSDLPDNHFLKYRYSALKISLFFFILAFFASYWGWTSANTELGFISDNRFLANIMFLGFVIAINERLLEVVTKTFRRRTRSEIQKQMESATDDGERKEWEQTLTAYSAETGRLTLIISLSVGCTLGCLGVVRLFGTLTMGDLMVSPVHIGFIDALDIVIGGWIVAGGSEGWNVFTTTLKSIITKKA